jgi:N-acetyl-anhydromuramyl-L-alanine amidase AmpD
MIYARHAIAACLLACVLAAAPSTRPTGGGKLRFVDKPMPAQSSARPSGMKIDFVMLHFCSEVLIKPERPFDIDGIIEVFRKAGASANYLIGRDGTIYRLVPEERAAWHAGKGSLAWDPSIKQMNPRSIGIEMFAIGSENDMKIFGMKDYAAYAKQHPENIGFTEAQYAALNELLKDIERRHPEVKQDRKHVIGHEDWAGRARRTDPGELFDWSKIDLGKTPPPAQPAVHD